MDDERDENAGFWEDMCKGKSVAVYVVDEPGRIVGTLARVVHKQGIQVRTSTADVFVPTSAIRLVETWHDEPYEPYEPNE